MFESVVWFEKKNKHKRIFIYLWNSKIIRSIWILCCFTLYTSSLLVLHLDIISHNPSNFVLYIYISLFFWYQTFVFTFLFSRSVTVLSGSAIHFLIKICSTYKIWDLVGFFHAHEYTYRDMPKRAQFSLNNSQLLFTIPMTLNCTQYNIANTHEYRHTGYIIGMTMMANFWVGSTELAHKMKCTVYKCRNGIKLDENKAFDFKTSKMVEC